MVYDNIKLQIVLCAAAHLYNLFGRFSNVTIIIYYYYYTIYRHTANMVHR